MPEASRSILAVRQDSLGDVLLMGPALRALRRDASRLDLLVSSAGVPAAELLPGIDEVIAFDPPWAGYESPALDARAILALVERIRERGYDEAVIFTSFHQSPLPMALLARLAGVPRVVGSSEDYAGSLLDVRYRRVPGGFPDTGGPEGGHEVPAALALVRASGHELPPGDDLRLRLRPLGRPSSLVLSLPRPYVVVHPMASVPSRSISPTQTDEVVIGLSEAGWNVVVTGGPAQVSNVTEGSDGSEGTVRTEYSSWSTARVTDLTGRTTLLELAHVLAGARCAVAVNSGPAHLAAAVGTPVVSLFSPVVPVERWGPWGVPNRVLGDQVAGCRGTRARECPIEGHPCLSSVSPAEVVTAVRELAGLLSAPVSVRTSVPASAPASGRSTPSGVIA